MVGMDIGSTTIKAVVLDPATDTVLWKRYERHETRQPEKALAFLREMQAALPQLQHAGIDIFLTGSGAGPLCDVVGARFVQEVNAVTMAVDHFYPDAGSVVELGGQDAKIILFRQDEATGERRAVASMNDKCASGTGATIDKCLLKVGLPQAELSRIRFDPERLHHVASKCGVFAETDVTNLTKAGVPADEVMNSLADAIVHQNLSVLTRGNTLRPKVLLLGGPNPYLPFLQACWRLRIRETWEQRGFAFDRDAAAEELIIVPDDSQYFAAFGAVYYGLLDPSGAARANFRGTEALEAYCRTGRGARLTAQSGPPLFHDAAQRPSFVEAYRIPPFTPGPFRAGEVVRAVVGLDAGSTSTKAVLVGDDGRVLRKAYRLSRGNPLEDTRAILAELRDGVVAEGARLQVIGFGVTGYAAAVISETMSADVNIVETVAHMMAAVSYFPGADVICDIGGQDIKVLFLENGDVKDFKLSNQCSAGNGMLLQSMADQFGVPLDDYAETAFRATLSPLFSYGCAVFLDTDRVSFQREGYSKEELLAGLALVLPKNIWQYVVGVPRLAEFGTHFVLQGGTQKNLAAVKAQVDYIVDRVPGARVDVHPHCGEAGALGTAMETLRVVSARGESRFIGLDAAIELRYRTRNDEGTRCTSCTNHCTRTFIDTESATGEVIRFIAGYSCEKGSVETKDELKAINRRRNALQQQFPNMAVTESELAFRHVEPDATLPVAGSRLRDARVFQDWRGRIHRTPYIRGVRRSTEAAALRRAGLRIGLPRVLGLYSFAPFFANYFMCLGIPRNQVVWSDETTDELFSTGGRYGSVDPCFPSKVVQAHIHNLIYDKHLGKRTGPLDYVYFPSITDVPSFLTHVRGNTSCTVLAGTPKVIRAAFTKEVDFFARAGIVYVDDAVNLEERNLGTTQLFETWGERLNITWDEHVAAVAHAWRAQHAFEASLEREGGAILDQVVAERRMAVVLLGRPYHDDEGVNHGIPDELQAQGYPVLTLRSIPKDSAWLGQFFADDIRAGRIDDVFDIRDVWPENFSANSAQKVWATKFVARHPHLAALDLSSFKCGHDAPTYGIMDEILKAAGTPRLIMHDLDANKAVGSISIRTRTFAYALSRHTAQLQARPAQVVAYGAAAGSASAAAAGVRLA